MTDKIYYVAMLVLDDNFMDSIRIVPEKDFSVEWLAVNCPLTIEDSGPTFEYVYNHVVDFTESGDVNHGSCSIGGYYKQVGVKGSWVIMKASPSLNIDCKPEKITISNLKLSDGEYYSEKDEGYTLEYEEYEFYMFDIIGSFTIFKHYYDKSNNWYWEIGKDFFDEEGKELCSSNSNRPKTEFDTAEEALEDIKAYITTRVECLNKEL